jgi:Flp pilus assembly pilin Flp
VSKLIREIWESEDGVTSVEYALMLVLVVIASVTAWGTLGQTVKNRVDDVTNSIGS